MTQSSPRQTAPDGLPGWLKRRNARRNFRQIVPWALLICAGVYAPLEVRASLRQVDADGIWNSASNWNGAIPTATDAVADFSFGFNANRTISLAGPPAISPQVGTVRFNDLSPGSVLTLAETDFQLTLKASSGSALFDISRENTLALTGTTAASMVLGGTSGLTKMGAGTLDVQAAANYTGPTTLNEGIFIASGLGNSAGASSLGSSTFGPAGLVFNGGTLRFVAASTVFGSVTTGRGFTIGVNPNDATQSGATIDNSSNFANFLVIGGSNNVIAYAGLGDRSLSLRGSNTGSNELQATLSDTDANHKTTLIKRDAGLWRLNPIILSNGFVYNPNVQTTNGPTNYTGEQYSGSTVVQRGTLQLVFPGLPVNPVVIVGMTPAAYTYFNDVSVLSPSSVLELGSVPGSGQPGGGTLDTIGGQVQRTQFGTGPNIQVTYHGTIQSFAGLVVHAGASQITRTLTGGQATQQTPYVYFNNLYGLVHEPGGTLRLASNDIVRTDANSGPAFGGVLNGWTFLGDNWVVAPFLDSGVLFGGFRTLEAAPSSFYRTANDSTNAPANFTAADNILVSSPLATAVRSSSTAGRQFAINTLLLNGAPAAPLPNKQLRISSGTEAGQPDLGLGLTILNLATGGLLMTSGSSVTQIDGGAITSGSGDFATDASDPQNPIRVGEGGGTLGHGEIFVIVNSGSANPLHLSSKITNEISQYTANTRLTVGLTKSGTGNLVLSDSTSTGTAGAALSDFQGDTFINEGGLFIRADHALGATADDATTFHLSGETVGKLGQTYLVGATSVLDFQGVRYTAPEKVNYALGEIRASVGRSTFFGSIANLNKETKAVLNIGSYLELNGALTGVGGFQKTGTGLLVVNGSTTLKTVSELVDAGNLELATGVSSWNGDVSITNGSLSVLAGTHSINGGLAITNGHVISTVFGTATLALTKPGALYNFDLQQSGSNATTLFGSLNQTAGDGRQVLSGLVSLNPLTGAPTTNGGALIINGSIDFATASSPLPFNLTAGTISQNSTVNAQLIPTTNLYGATTFALSGSTITLNHNTNFNAGLTLGSAANAVNLVANGLGVTTFKGALSVLNSGDTLTLANSSFGSAYIQSIGTLTLNGLDAFHTSSGSALTITGGAIVETGTRRSTGVYGVQNLIGGDLALTNAPSATVTLAPTFTGSDEVDGNIVITGSAPLTGVVNGTGVTNSIVTATFGNQQRLSGTLTVNGGQVAIASSNALGAGSNSPGSPASATVIGGVTLAGEKSSLFFQRGVETAAGEDITIGPSYAYVSGIAVTKYGAGYGSAPTIAVTGGGASLVAMGTSTLGGNSLGSVTVTSVGAVYTSTPLVSVNGVTTNATAAAVFGGAIIRGADQHNVIDGSIILDNTITSTANGTFATIGAISLGTPLISVGQDDTLQIKGDIFGVENVTLSTNGTRKITTAILGGGANNSSSGILLLSGQVKDSSSGGQTGNNVLNFEIAGSNDLNVFMEKSYVSNGLLQLAQGVLRDTNAVSTNFFATGVTGNFSLSVDNTNLGRASVGFNSTVGAAANIQTAALFLTQPGQVFNANIAAYLGNSNKVFQDGSNTGFIVVGGENTSGTVTIGTGATGAGNGNTIALSTDSSGALRDLRLLANAGGTMEIKANFTKVTTGSGFVSIDKVGDGTVILDSAGTSSVLDRTYVLGGVLELGGFSANTGIQRLSTNAMAATIFGGGTLRLNTAGATAGATIGQSVLGATVVRNGLSTIQVANSGQTDTFTFGSGVSTALTRNTGGVLRVSQTGTGTSSVILNNSITRAVPVPWLAFDNSTEATAALRATHFGFVDMATGQASNYLGATSQDDVTQMTAPNSNYEENGAGFFASGAGFNQTALNTLRFNGASTTDHGVFALGAVALSVNGGIMVSSDTVGDRTITGGTSIAAGSTFTDLIIQNWGNTNAKLTIATPIVNVGANLSGLTLAGDGTTVLTNAANNFKGDVYLSGGTLQVASAAPLGADTGLSAVAIKSLQMDGGTLQATGDFTWTNRNIVVYGDRSTLSIASGKTFTLTGGATGQSAPTLAFTGGINSQSPEVANNLTGSLTGYGSGTANVPATGASNIFSGDLVITGGGNFVQIRDGAANTIAGQMFIQGNTEFSYEGNNFGFLGNNLSWMDGTTIQSGSTIEIRPTVNSTTANSIGEWLRLSGSGKPGTGGALVMNLPTAAVNAAATLADHTVSWTGPVTMDNDSSVFVADTAETFVAGTVGMLSFDDNLFDGGNKALTKNGPGSLRFINGRIQNLTTINVLAGELRFEAGLLGTVGSEANKAQSGGGIVASASAAAGYSNYTTGTNSIVVGSGSAAAFTANPRLSFVDARGIHNTNVTLNGGYLFVQSADAPLQATSFAGDFTLSGPAAANSLEVIFTNRVNPIVMFGALVGGGGLTKFGNNEIDFVNPGSTFSGDLVIAKSGASVTSPSIGLYDGGRFTAVRALRLTNDGTLNLDNQNSLDADPGNDNQADTALNPTGGRINNAAEIHLGGGARLRLLGNNSAASTETVGALHLHQGSSAIELDPGADATGALQNAGMTFASYERDPGGVVNFRVLKAGVNFGAAAGAGTANITLGAFPTGSLIGGDGSLGGQNRPVLIGAFGGVVARNFSTLPANTSLPLALNNNDELFAARGLMTVETVGGINYLRPLTAGEYLNASRTGTRATDTYDFGANYSGSNGSQKNVRLTGGFGPSTSTVAEALFATEGNFIFDQSDASRKQDSLYRVLENISFNSLTFAQQTSELVDQGGNRIALEISPDKTLTIGSGMILAAGLGVINVQDPNPAHTSTQQSFIRGGTLDFGSREAIIQNVAAGLNETSGLIANSRLAGTNSAIAANNLSLSDLTIASSIHGASGLTKSGSGGVNLSGPNTYAGDTNVTEGILRLENDRALGQSALVAVGGTGELRLQRGIVVGSALNPHALTLRFSSLAQTSQLKSEAGNNAFYGDLQVDALNSAGGRLTTAANPFDISVVNGTGSGFTIGGDIYGLDAASGGATPLNDVQGGRQSRIVNFQNSATTGGVLQLRGAFHDLQPIGAGSGAVSSLITSANEDQVLRAVFTGGNNGNFFVSSQWDAAGSILLRQGALRVMPAVTDFFSTTAANSINPFNAQSRPAIGDSAGGETSLTLTAAGQTFNSPSLIVGNMSPTSNVLIGGENTSGTVKFFAPSASGAQFNNANLRVSEWDRNVRLTAAQGGTVEIYGRITDGSLAGGFAGGNGSITKMGLGTVVMKGMDGNTAGYVIGTSGNNDFDKGIAVAAGQLVLDYNVSSATNTTIDTTAFNQWGSSTVGLTLESGKLELLGDSTTAITQSWTTSLITRPGNSEVAVIPVGTGTLTLNLGVYNGSVTRATGSTINFVSPGSAGKINFLASTSLGNGGTILAPWTTFGTTMGTASDFVVTTADLNRTVGPLPAASYTTSTNPGSFNAGNIASEGSTGFAGGALTSGVKMLRFGAPSVASTLNIGTGFILGNGGTTDEGSILVPSGVNATKTIAGGDLQVSGAKELFLINYGTGGLKITTPIVGTQVIVLSGPGKTMMGANRQAGSVYLNDGVLEVSRLNFDQTLTFPVGDFTPGQTTITLPAGADFTNIRTGMQVTGTNIPANTVINSIVSGSNQIIISGGATVSASNTITIAPSAAGTTALSFVPATFSGSTLTAPTNQSGLAVGEAVVGAGIPNGTVINAITGTLLSLSASPTANGFVTVGLPNGLGLASAFNGVVINGGTLRYTGPSVLTDRIFTIGDAGATFDISQAAAVVQVAQFTASFVIGIGSGSLPFANTYAGGLTKIGLGTLIATGAASTYSGLTDIKAGTLQVNNNGTPLGTSTNALDGTIVRSNATLRLIGGAADFATGEWLTFENNATLDFQPTATRTINLDGVTNFQGRLNLTYSGASAGSSTISFNQNAGYLTGSGDLVKGTVNSGVGGQLSLNENSPEWTGSLAVLGGRVFLKSLGTPAGTGAKALSLGTSGANDLTSSVSTGSPEASLFFQIRDVVNANGASSLTGALDSFQVTASLAQDIVVNRPSDAIAGAASSQLKRIGVVGPGLSLDQYNLNGNLRLQDDLQLYVEDNFANVNTGEELVNLNLNGHLISEGGYVSTLSTRVNLTGRPAGALNSAYNNLYLVVSLNNSNPAFTGNVTIGNVNANDSLGFAIANPDANHVLRLNNDAALSSVNTVTLLSDATFQLVGHRVAIGSLIDLTLGTGQTIFTGGTTTGFITGGARAIVENGSNLPAQLTVNQTSDSDWKFLIRDGGAGALALVKAGPALVRVLNANSYTGGTTVTGGTLLVHQAGPGSALGSGPVSVLGAAFGGDNIATAAVAGALTISDDGLHDGVLTPGRVLPDGSTTGDKLFLSALTFTHTASGRDRAEFDTYGAESSSVNDLITSTSLTIDAPVDLVLRINGDTGFGHIFQPGESIPLFVSSQSPITFGSGSDAGSFTFSGIPLANGSEIDGFYRDATGQRTAVPFAFAFAVSSSEIRLYAIPEPAVGLSFAYGLGLLLGLRRSRRPDRAYFSCSKR